MANLAVESLVFTEGTLCSALETRSENKEQLSNSFKKVKKSKEVPLFVYPRDKFCAFCFLTKHMETTNKRQKLFNVFHRILLSFLILNILNFKQA